MSDLSDSVERKFVDVIDLSDWETYSDSGWHAMEDIKQTVEYEIWHLELEDGSILDCADTHIVFDNNMQEIFVKDLAVGGTIQTINGLTAVVSITNTQASDNMYDVGVNSPDHRYYTNGILSHNTTTAAGYLLWYAMFVPDSTILVAAHKYTGSQEIMQRIRYAYESVPDHIRAGSTSYNKGSLEFDNGSRIVSATTTENTGRGLSISLLYMDEFAFVRNTIAREFWTSITPTLSTGGKAIITSTPNSDEDQFWEIWLDANRCYDEFGNVTEVGRNGFKAFTVLWNEHPDRDAKWEKEMRAQLTDARFDREHNCRPIIFEETLIDAMTLVDMGGIDPIERQGQIRWYQKPSKNSTYVVALDPSLGTGGDFAAIQVIELPSFRQVAEWQHNKTPIQQQIKILRDIVQYLFETTQTINNIYYSVENNSLGEAALVAIDELGEHLINGVFLSEPRKPGVARSYRKGFTTTHKSKLVVCAKFKQLLESKKLKVASKPLISELKTFVASGNSFAARVGDHDDLVSAVLLAVRMMQILQNYDAQMDTAMRGNEPYAPPMPFIMF